MKKFKTTIAILALSTTMLLTACGSSKSNTVAPKPTVNVYQEYKSVLSTVQSVNPAIMANYSLFDINNDGLYELITNDGSWIYNVYTIKNDQLFFSGEVNSKYGIYTYQDILLASNGGTGYCEYKPFSLDENYCVVMETVPFVVHESMAPSSPEVVYHHNGKEISEKEYEQYKNEMYQLPVSAVHSLSRLELVK